MILESKTETLVLEDGEVQDSVKMEIDADSHIFLMRMLSKFYSDGIGSLIRETASNALDSHRASGVKKPIVVSFGKVRDGNFEFSVEDFGSGLDDQDVDNIIKKYGKSTKRNSDTQLGAFGLGFKSPLAYTSSFYFIGRKNGIERKYMLYESDDESNKIDLLYESPTTECNGVKIIVPVKWGDKEEFTRKIKQQLAYFEDVYFNVDQGYGAVIDNSNVKIVRHEHFQWSSLASDNNMHICLDNVYYPIDFNKLGIGSITVPIGLRFSLKDNIFPVPNREQLKYTPEAKKIILDKIKLVSEYFVTKYNENVKNTDNIFELIQYFNDNSRKVIHPKGEGTLNIKELERFATTRFVEPKMEKVKYLTPQEVYRLRDFLLMEYQTQYFYSNNKFTAEKENNYRSRLSLDKVESGNVYIYSELSGLKKAYLRDSLGYSAKYFVKKSKPLKLGDTRKRYTGTGMNTYMNILSLYNKPKSEWRDRIKEFQYIISLVTNKFIDVDKMEIPQEWLDARKKQRVEVMEKNGTKERRKKLTGEITAKVAYNLERYVSGKNCKFVSEVISMKDAYKDPKFTIYGKAEDETVFQKLFTVLDKKVVRLIILSDREIKNLKDVKLHNWMELSKFMEGKHRIFRRAVTAYLISKLANEFNAVFNKTSLLREVSAPLGDKITMLDGYRNQHFHRGNDALLNSMVKVAEEHKLFDTVVYDVYKEVDFVLHRLPFLEPICSVVSRSSNEAAFIKILRDLFKHYKQKMDWQNYTLPITEEIVVELETKEEEKLEEVTEDSLPF